MADTDAVIEIKEENETETENGAAETPSTQESVENTEENENLSKQEKDIIRQVEYYFSESNLRRDKFLINKIAENDEGWVPIGVLLTFNRLKKLSEDANVVADALKKSSRGIVQVSEDNEKVRRYPENPLPELNETRRKELQKRTAYAKGFPLDSKMSTLVEYFNNNFKNVENVVMRKYFCQTTKNYLFKGSVFVLFENVESAEEFVNKPEIKYNEKELLRYMQEKYFEVKKEEKAKSIEKIKAKKAAKAVEEANELQLPKKSIVRFVGVTDKELSREDIKRKVAEIDPALTVAFIHYEKGNTQGELRFAKEDDGSNFLEKLEDGKFPVKDIELTMTLLEGEDEEAFLKQAIEDIKKVRQRLQQKNQKGKRGNFNNRNKRKNEDSTDTPSAKQQKTTEAPDNAPIAAAVE